MNKKWLLVCSSVAVVAITAAITYSVSYSIAMDKFNKKVAEVNERQAMYTKLSELDQDVRQKYIGKIDEEKLMDAMRRGYIEGLSNKYSLYLSEDEYQNYSSIESGKFIGIGISIIKNSKPKSIKFMCIIAAPEGMNELTKAHPDVKIYCAAMDECLNEHGYIVPGLGDAGDRIFGTK